MKLVFESVEEWQQAVESAQHDCGIEERKLLEAATNYAAALDRFKSVFVMNPSRRTVPISKNQPDSRKMLDK